VNGYVAAGYASTLAVLAGYALHVLRRARILRARASAASDVRVPGGAGR
jgi:hypothetical protein